MAIVATTPETLVEAARSKIVGAGVVADASAFAVDDPDESEKLGAVLDDFAAAVWWREASQDPHDVSTEPPTDEIPVVGGTLVVSAFVRHQGDPAGRSGLAMADQTAGQEAFVRRIVRSLNDKDLDDGSDTVTMESLTFRRAAKRGRMKAKGYEAWRRVDVSFDLLFRWDLRASDSVLELAESGDFVLAESGDFISLEA